MSKPSMKRVAGSAARSPSPPPLRRKIESTTTSKSVASFFTPVSKKEPEKMTWRVVHNSLLVGRYKPVTGLLDSKMIPPKRRKIAAFDFVDHHTPPVAIHSILTARQDSTLIQTSSGNVFGNGATDWRWWHVSVPTVLKKLYGDGFLVVVISNQGGISLKSDPKTVKSDQRRLSQFKSKVNSVFVQLDFPISLYAATARDQYRKPRTGMWKELVEDFDLDVDGGLDLQQSIFVGDAGGRSARGATKADHSSSDRDFASNVGIGFKTPEEYFLDETPEPFSRSFDPKLYLPPTKVLLEGDIASGQPSPDHVKPEESSVAFEKKNELDVVLFCGSPAAGKSTFYWSWLKPLGYERVNQDLLKTVWPISSSLLALTMTRSADDINIGSVKRDKCLRVASEHLSSGSSVAVDNTNADPDTRGHWIQLAQKVGVPIRCIYFTAPTKLCEHNDTVRALNEGTWNPEKRQVLPRSAFSGYAARFNEPKLKEGFQDITRVPFQFRGDEGKKKVWSMYWI
ncbi:hypothetical protein MMC30_007175 [Trapelia coarctata]|nr:hypothetical protein [Trapelia coarctata]